MFLKITRLLVVGVFVPYIIHAQGAGNKTDTTIKNNNTVVTPKPYEQVITEKAVTEKGLFTVHKIQEKYFFEIPDSLLGREILLVNRISKAPAGARSLNGLLGFSGDQIGEKIVRFERGPNYKLFLKGYNQIDYAEDSSKNGMYQSVTRSNLEPIIASFDIQAFNKDSSAVVIELTNFLAGDNSLFFFDNSLKTSFGVGSIQADKCYVESIKPFPINIEITTVKTYGAEGAARTFELNSSIVLLPKDSMKPHYADDRVGYFAAGYRDFDVNPQGVEQVNVITRWRLEPKDEDIDKYLRGELVEPKHPIVYYIDPATPQKWVPYLIQGVNDWQAAFEQAGFKNAIYALEAPTNDSTWSLYDARHNAIVYKPSEVANASGPNIHDPRTGEIIETHINWYHNVMQLIRDWYMIQAGPNDPRARKMEFDDSLMGQLIRFVCCHEVGHTLGLLHNFGASSTVPVEKLRDKKWVEENGFCPSIMDYARFNYVAQPQDSLSERELMPRIGIYDKWAIEWGYRWFPESKFRTKDEEKAYMNDWIIAQLKKDKRYWYGAQNIFGVSDPRNQSEDLGDDAMKASYYGIQNLKRIMPRLLQWTREPNKDYSGLEELNQQVIAQYQRYIDHVVNNIGLYTWDFKTIEEAGNVVGFIPKEKQKQAVQFLQEQLFTTPNWLLNKGVFAKVGGAGLFLPQRLQIPVLQKLLSYKMYARFLYFQGQEPQKAYAFNELLSDLEKGIWKELATARPIDYCRRQLQAAYTQRLLDLWDPYKSSNAIERIMEAHSISQSDIPTIVSIHAKAIITSIDGALPRYSDKMSREHLLIVRKRLHDAFNKNNTAETVEVLQPNDQKNGIKEFFPELKEEKKSIGENEFYWNCWSDKVVNP